MCPSGATCLSTDCCFSELALLLHVRESIVGRYLVAKTINKIYNNNYIFNKDLLLVKILKFMSFKCHFFKYICTSLYILLIVLATRYLPTILSLTWSKQLYIQWNSVETVGKLRSSDQWQARRITTLIHLPTPYQTGYFL
jgi:hypothetical protein